MTQLTCSRFREHGVFRGFNGEATPVIITNLGGNIDGHAQSLGGGSLGSEIFHTVAKVGEIQEGQGMPVEIEGRVIAVFLDEGTYFALDDNCPHQGAPLCDGIVHKKSVTCTWHGWRFDMTNGQWVDSPRIRVTTYPVRVVGDEVQVGVYSVDPTNP